MIGSGTTTLSDYPHPDHELPMCEVAVGYTEVSIVDVDDPEKELAFGKKGEIALRGPSVVKGYSSMLEATAAVFRKDGWFLTGDIGYLDEEGILYITDQKKDMIIISGGKIYPNKVENVIIQHPAIADVAVFCIPDEHKGEVPVAAVVLKTRISLTETEPGFYCRTHPAGYKIPRTLVIVDSLARVLGWKLLHRTLRETYLTHSASP